MEWPPAETPDLARWEGRFAAGTVAIIHTHRNWLSASSNRDVETARKLGLPVYVITRTQISKTWAGSVDVVFAVI